MATATPSSGEGRDEEKAGSGELIELRKTKKKSDVHAPELSEIVDSGNATECEVNHVQFENVELKQALGEAAKQSKAESKIAELEKQLNQTRQSPSAVGEQLTVADQVTAATQQRALQESDNSEQLQLELAPDQPAECTGLAVSFKSV